MNRLLEGVRMRQKCDIILDSEIYSDLRIWDD